MLNCISADKAKITEIGDTRSVQCYPVIRQEVTGQEFEVDAELLDILCCVDIQKNRVGAT